MWKDKIAIIVIILIIVAVLYEVNVYNRNHATVKENTTVNVFEGDVEIEEFPQHHLVDAEENELEVNHYGFRAFNPSVTLLNDYLITSFRVSNYIGCSSRSGKGKRQHFSSGDMYDSFTILNIDGNDNIYLVTPDYAWKGCVKGFEDGRIIASPDGTNLHMIANNHSNEGCYSEMYVLTIPASQIERAINTKTVQKSIEVTDILRLYIDPDDPEPTNHEKNWMPFFHENKLLFVYSVQPHVILECDMETGYCMEIARTDNPNVNSHLRGSSQVRRYGDYYIAIAHWRTSTMSYLSQAYKFDAKPPFAIRSMSPTFVFDDVKTQAQSSIQFVSGFEIVNDVAYITYGEQDCDSKLFKVDMQSLLNSMESIEN